MCEYPSEPLAYFITFTTYGTWMHGDERGSVDFDNRVYGTPFVKSSERRVEREARNLEHPPVVLDEAGHGIVEETINEVCRHRDWTVHALNVRTNHVHIVVGAGVPPERVMNQLKSWTTRRMTEAGLIPAKTKTWTRHGSTGYLWRAEQVVDACRYVVEGQGDDLASG